MNESDIGLGMVRFLDSRKNVSCDKRFGSGNTAGDLSKAHW